jgi:hypothetical protein
MGDVVRQPSYLAADPVVAAAFEPDRHAIEAVQHGVVPATRPVVEVDRAAALA